MRKYLLILGLLFLSACWENKNTGPVEIKFGRDQCVFCGMAIEDPRFAAQIRGGEKHKAYKFDDLGDALTWLKRQSWADDPKLEIWVGDINTGKWIDAKKAFYLQGVRSPMDHGYGAVSAASDKTIGFEEMKKRVYERGAPNICEPENNSQEKDQK